MIGNISAKFEKLYLADFFFRGMTLTVEFSDHLLFCTPTWPPRLLYGLSNHPNFLGIIPILLENPESRKYAIGIGKIEKVRLEVTCSAENVNL